MTESITTYFLRRLKRSAFATQKEGEESSEGLLHSHGSSRPHYKRQLSASSLRRRKKAWAACAAILGLFLMLWVWGGPPEEPYAIEEALLKYTGVIPWGQARNVDGREVFWWEQFPMMEGFYGGRKTIVPLSKWFSEQKMKNGSDFKPSKLTLDDVLPYAEHTRVACYLDANETIPPPTIRAYLGQPQGMPDPLFGSAKELGFREDVCYDRINRFAPYGAGYNSSEGGLSIGMSGDSIGLEEINKIDYRDVKWDAAQSRCSQRNTEMPVSRKAFVIRTWHDHEYTSRTIMMLRAMISELSIASGGEYTVHFLIHVRDDSIDIWGSKEAYRKVLQSSLPPEFEGMGTLWNIEQMKKIYPGPFPKPLINFSGGPIYSAYRSLHWAMQYFATQHSEFDYFWHWEMDLRVTGHYYELLNEITKWAEKQSTGYLWERNSKFYIPALYNDSYAEYARSVETQAAASKRSPISGPLLPESDRLHNQSNDSPHTATDTVDLITFNPIFDTTHTRWAFRDDITGYPLPPSPRPPTLASLITASRLSRRLLLTMHEETLQRQRTMFPEMFPTSIAVQYGYKAVYAPIPVWMDRDWPAQHADEVFNNAKISKQGYAMGMIEHGDGYFHGKGGSVFGPGEHVFRGAGYYSSAGFAGPLWRTWLGTEGGRAEWEEGGGKDMGRMCLPMMVLHPVKHE